MQYKFLSELKELQFLSSIQDITLYISKYKGYGQYQTLQHPLYNTVDIICKETAEKIYNKCFSSQDAFLSVQQIIDTMIIDINEISTQLNQITSEISSITKKYVVLNHCHCNEYYDSYYDPSYYDSYYDPSYYDSYYDSSYCDSYYDSSYCDSYYDSSYCDSYYDSSYCDSYYDSSYCDSYYDSSYCDSYYNSYYESPLSFKATTPAEIKIKKYGNPAPISLEYSINDTKFQNYTIGNTIELEENDILIIQAAQSNNTISESIYDYYNFNITGNIIASGNIQTLLSKDGKNLSVLTLCFYKLFAGCTTLTQAPELPATTLADNCYYNMFAGCTSLTQAPELPATELAYGCYWNMFSGCTSLTQAPALPATTLANWCYRNMFSNCTTLTQAPELPATTLADECYDNMFYNCSSLTSAPELQATELAYGCYQNMFSGCNALTQAPELPATTLAYGCYGSMFYGCSKLNNINVNFSAWNPLNATENWVTNVASSGTFTCPANLPETYGTSNIPTGWTVAHPQPIDYLCFTAEEPNATLYFNNEYADYDNQVVFSYDKQNWSTYEYGTEITLVNAGDKVYFRATDDFENWTFNGYIFNINTGKIAASGNLNTLLKADGSVLDLTGRDGCYQCMFYDCTSLTEAPELPATTLSKGCYSNMFCQCSSLTQAPELPATTLANRCYNSMFIYCTSLTQASFPNIEKETVATEVVGYQGAFIEAASDIETTCKDGILIINSSEV